jgi:hypothetical protein
MRRTAYPSWVMISGMKLCIRQKLLDWLSKHMILRPDYKKLSLLRTLFPRVPILALSATCPPAVLKDLLLLLRLKPIVDGSGT